MTIAKWFNNLNNHGWKNIKICNLTQMTIISTTVGRNPLEEMELPLWSTKESEIQYLDAISKMTEWSLFPRQIIQYHSNTSLCPTSNAEEAEVEWYYEDLQDLLELTLKKRCPFHYSGLEWKSRKSRNAWRNRQIWPWHTEWSRAKANRVLPREHTGHKNTLFQQHKRRLYTWTSAGGQ